LATWFEKSAKPDLSNFWFSKDWIFWKIGFVVQQRLNRVVKA
jgi:hypothetical protein